MKKISNLFLLFCLISTINGCSTNPVSGKSDFVLISDAQENQLGTQGHQEIMQEYRAYNNPALQTYVNQIGQALAQQSHRQQLSYHFTVLDSAEINAFALPGGYVYITRGILAYLNSEAQLAGVLGHEIGHITARHGVKQQSVNMVSGLAGSLLGQQIGGEKLINVIGGLLTRGYGRNHELEADKLGAEYLARVGYHPENMIRVVEVLKAQEEFGRLASGQGNSQPSSYHGLFSTHPSNDKRLQQVILEAKRFQSAGSRKNNPYGYLEAIKEMPFTLEDGTQAQIKRIQIRQGDTLKKLAKRSAFKTLAEEQLRLLNGLYPKGKIRVGQWIKTVQ